jgi:CRISPR/Cas system CMR subunit Cmr4 (Cas7 group RAMP superfamily)
VKVSFAKDAYLFVYPNPTQDKVFVETTEPEKLKQIYLHNIKGEKMTFITKIENNKVILDLSHLSNGLYVLQLHFEDNFVTEKLAIQK